MNVSWSDFVTFVCSGNKVGDLRRGFTTLCYNPKFVSVCVCVGVCDVGYGLTRVDPNNRPLLYKPQLSDMELR